jgi:hypothetical protein
MLDILRDNTTNYLSLAIIIMASIDYLYLPIIQLPSDRLMNIPVRTDLIWFDLLCLTPLSAIVQLYYGDQF